VSSKPFVRVGEPAPEDLTARARIRDAALLLFAEHGVGGASIRDIAAAAGVSSGLVRHHFGSKEELRNACDAYAMDQMVRLREQAVAGGGLADEAFMGSMHRVARVLRRYLLRSMLDGSAPAAAMFDEVVTQAEDWLRAAGAETRDLRAAAVVVCVMQLAGYLMPTEVSRALGADVQSDAGTIRLNRGLVDILANALLTPAQRDELHTAIDRIAGTGTEAGTETGTTPEGEGT
jgi:TetR/AcrR family transcriptional regulator, regulator of cefoperazone and chloramphenicol sensitivity